MKRKTSITLSEEVYRALERYAGPGGSRSAYIERVLRRHFRRREWAAGQEEDRMRIDRAAGALNEEMAAVLSLQAPWTDEED